ncbi:MAG: hypothetical protein PHN31_03210 [Candidatus Gracilibacteria bacterium]|nr:hypothetical protein [Candidatus Gracilibacteria bacterium]
MKKSKLILSLFIFINLISNLQNVDAFLDEDLGLDLYNNIDEGIDNLEAKNYSYIITKGGTDTIAEKINEIIGKQCIKDNIDISSLYKIVAGDVKTLNDYTTDECKYDGGSIMYLTTLQENLEKITDIHNETIKQSEEKTKMIYSVSRIGLYSDGNEENSPFDLIKDVENINNIIFSITKEYKYEGTEKSSLGDFLGSDFGTNDINSDYLINGTSPLSSKTGSTTNSGDTTTTNDSNTKTNNNNSESNTYYGNGYVCSTINSLDLTGLNKTDLDDIMKAINNNNNTSTDNNSSSTGTNNNSKYIRTYEEPSLTGNLNYLSSNEVFFPESKCDSFFCITIEFKTSNHNLLGGGTSKNKSIEGVIQNSNEHLYKYSHTALEQHQMTMNNWESSIKNLSLSDIFSFNVIVFFRDVPGLNIEKNKSDSDESKENSSYSANSLLSQYYSKYGLDYTRANSIEDFYSNYAQLKSLNDSTEISTADANEEYNQYKTYLAEKATKDSLLSNIINTKEKYDNIEDMQGLFGELFSFTNTFEIYTQGVITQIKQMSEKYTR